MKINPEHISEDNPESTAEDFAKSRSAKEVLPELFGKKVTAEMPEPKRGHLVPAKTEQLLHVDLSHIP